MPQALSNIKQSFRESSSLLIQAHGTEGAVYFTTRAEEYDFVLKNHLEINAISLGSPIGTEGLIKRCINTRLPVSGIIKRDIYGVRLQGWIFPIFEEDDERNPVIGTCGMYVQKTNLVDSAFDVFAPLIIASHPEGAWIGVSDLKTVTHRRGTEKFDFDNYQIGESVEDDFNVRKIISKKEINQFDLKTPKYGPVRVTGIPLFDEETHELTGTFSITVPRHLPHDLQHIAGKLNANTQEMAGVMQEIAASAGEINLSEGKLAEIIQHVRVKTAHITEILGFIKDVTDQTKMLGLNAAIEAARAAEHGRGFGVVAEEIRKLSDQTKQTTDQIVMLISEIDHAVQDAVIASEETVKNSQEQAAATQAITASVMELSEMAEKLIEIAQAL